MCFVNCTHSSHGAVNINSYSLLVNTTVNKDKTTKEHLSRTELMMEQNILDIGFLFIKCRLKTGKKNSG